MKSYTIQEINAILNGVIIGNTTQNITAPEQLEMATASEISFIGNKKYEKLWFTSNACAAVVNEDIAIEPGENRAFIKVKNADLAMSQVLELFAPPTPVFTIDIHPSAVIDPTASICTGARIGAGCYIGPNVIIGDNSTVYPNVTILDECTIGKNTVIWSGTVIRERCHIGNDCILHPNATIGADGFGFRPDPQRGLVKIPQIGNVIIGNSVEIGANTCVDRGKFSSTILGDGCKIDNLVQIGHNSKLGKFCIMAGNSGLAGSVTLGNGVIIGGSASIKDHTTIGDGAIVGAGSGVTGDIPAGKTMLGYPAVEARDALKQWAILKRLVNESKHK
ncbi:UDP-3-O-(3-hydroxymyristoyl)glucosamine N-acyltransferase [Flavobacterium sp. GSP27]|uniref:UDP-3-O-(3-hydroxymyristoyl)glucosamine N-acyltransferase n=1 Tax=unclassified Flavobacterium TaxID=196869 RepID=UPI000F816B4D|nr:MULTISPECIES: UDP-3-O-(3-hydroxymyristoyl)glucosamine N-acyltransferase [unclassified Flavobacterium]RTY96756.1 UDP-3-O-(3-hydroxymyristoyl)glucosamine N-acyltransferase [Flavobacterium sp. GSN2]RTY69478.1 UDP-3-O-(3-hydroxymyristoyl)glucosamine N-acyltransferase [Flavobacterium sp. LB2P53]RTY72698.1 UDP-3-O-(3-hydroxymyristoyl)glucosamine N-acyltransferase [Flavobacterium sp. LS1R10]RTY81044.1 UDP-3-O-(3-hydroxymyristoyl)glucosamine N-acyltransferase [Flavobacterium sp. ZB4P23]RTY81145.1 U